MTAQTQAFEQSVFGFKSERNSSVANLNAGATFAGLAETFASNEVFVTVKADQDGLLLLDFSDNQGGTFETKTTAYTANEYLEVHEFKAARTFRARFTNGSGGAQTSFSLNTYYGAFDAGGAADAIAQSIIDLTRSRTITSISATYTILLTDDLIDCTANTFTVTLPTAVGIIGRVFDIKNSGVGVITLEGDGSETIDDMANVSIGTKDDVQVTSNGTNWLIT